MRELNIFWEMLREKLFFENKMNRDWIFEKLMTAEESENDDECHWWNWCTKVQFYPLNKRKIRNFKGRSNKMWKKPYNLFRKLSKFQEIWLIFR